VSYSEKGYHRVNRIVATLFDGRTIAKGVDTYNCLDTVLSVSITIQNLNFVEEILNVQVHAPGSEDCQTWGQKNIVENVVGLTICGVADGVTAIVEIIAIGV